MELPVDLQKKIVEFLKSVPNIHDSGTQRSLILNAGLDTRLRDQIQFGGSAEQFVSLLVPLLYDYGRLEDGRGALVAVLRSARDVVGGDKQDYCDLLIREVQAIAPDEAEAVRQNKLVGMKQRARLLENTLAYDEAIAAWQEIGAFEEEQDEAQREIVRLEQKRAQSASLQSILQQFSSRIKDLKSHYMPVAKHLRRMQKEGLDEEGELLLEIVQKFLAHDLSTEEFLEIWQSSDIMPDARTNVNYDALARRLMRGEIIPVLGSEVHYRCGLPFPSSAQLAHSLAQEARYDDFSGPLSMISQYYEMSEYGRGTLLQSVQQALEQHLAEGNAYPLYQLLSNIPEPVLIISACYDRLLERHFTDKGKKFVVISHLNIAENSNQVLLKYSDRTAPEAPCMGEAISPLKLLEQGYSILYKVCGGFGISPTETSEEFDSLMISEEDYFAFARKLENIIPGYLSTQIKRKSLLFLGNSLNNWQDRLVLNAILEKNRNNRARSYAVEENPSKYELEYWKFHGVDLYQLNLTTFVEKLTEKT